MTTGERIVDATKAAGIDTVMAVKLLGELSRRGLVIVDLEPAYQRGWPHPKIVGTIRYPINE